MTTNFTDCYAVPGERSIIDGIHPETGLSLVNGETLEQVRARYPDAVRMPFEEWRVARGTEQDTPIQWAETTEEQYHDMLNVLPPAAWIGGAFLVGEPCDHSLTTGRARFQAYAKRGDGYVVSSRPLTVAEFKAQVTR